MKRHLSTTALTLLERTLLLVATDESLNELYDKPMDYWYGEMVRQYTPGGGNCSLLYTVVKEQ